MRSGLPPAARVPVLYADAISRLISIVDARSDGRLARGRGVRVRGLSVDSHSTVCWLSPGLVARVGRAPGESMMVSLSDSLLCVFGKPSVYGIVCVVCLVTV